MATLTASDISAEELAEFCRLDAERKDLDRQSRLLAKRQDQIRTHCRAVLDGLGKTDLVRYGYRLSIVEGRATVAWKDAFIEQLGPEAAAELVDAAVPSLVLQILPPGEERAAA